MAKFDFKEHEKRMRDILNQKSQEGQRPLALQDLLNKAKTMRKGGKQ